MGTVAEKLEYLNDTKVAIRNAIEGKGGNVEDNDTFRSYANKITNLVAPEVNTIKGLIQGDCANLVIPEGTTTIRSYAFYRYANPITITMPNSVTTLENFCFMSCSGLTAITLSNQIQNIPSQAFNGTNLTSIVIPDSVTTMEYGAFMGCSNLTNVTLSKNLTNISGQAFSQCSKLTNLEIPNSVTTIENSVFSYGYQLKTIHIPASVTSINSNAFSSCGLTSIYVDKPNNGIAGCPWGATSATVYWNDGTKREPLLDDILG